MEHTNFWQRRKIIKDKNIKIARPLFFKDYIFWAETPDERNSSINGEFTKSRDGGTDYAISSAAVFKVE